MTQHSGYAISQHRAYNFSVTSVNTVTALAQLTYNVTIRILYLIFTYNNLYSNN